MRIFMACPAPPGSRKGNRVTAARWAAILQHLGHRLTIAADFDRRSCDLLIALHARKSYPAIVHYRRTHPEGPLIVALTGTDLYRDIRTSRRAQRSLELADRLVLLQPGGLDELAQHLRPKARVIYQSAEPAWVLHNSRPGFRVIVLGHLRSEKDPFRAAYAVRRLPAHVPIRLTHLGEALSEAMERRAQSLMHKEPRYRWLGEVSRTAARKRLAASDLMVLSSRMEGGANVLSEAIANGVPVLASHISGNVGILGPRYPGYYTVGDTAALAELLRRAWEDSAFYARLEEECVALRPLVEPERESAAWRKLLREIEEGR
jgi:putative glycosyltransferase (TIGR04348 family)